MGQEVEDGNSLSGDSIVQAKLGKIITYWPGPVDTPLAVQECNRGRGEGFGDRADHELCCGGDRQVRLNVPLTIGLRDHHLTVLHHCDSCAGHLPIGHCLSSELIELGAEPCNAGILCLGCCIHTVISLTDRTTTSDVLLVTGLSELACGALAASVAPFVQLLSQTVVARVGLKSDQIDQQIAAQLMSQSPGR